MHHYKLYHLHLASDLEIPGAGAFLEDKLEIDVFIRFGTLPPPSRGEVPAFFPGAVSQPGPVTLEFQRVGRYCVTGGREVVIDACPGASPRALVYFLLNAALGVLLYQRSLFPLHGSAVETPEGALIFVGPSGSGKSTLAAIFRRRGYRVLSDEISGVAQDGRGGFSVLPAFPQLVLCEDVHARFGAGEGWREGGRYVVPLDKSFCPLPTPLRAICFLKSHGEPSMSLRPLVGLERVACLLANAYRPEFREGLEGGAEAARMAGNLARGADLQELLRPWDPERLEEGGDLLEAVLAGGKSHLKKRRA